MSSTIDVNMSICDKKVSVTATMKEDGTFDIDIQSDCDSIKHYAETLKNVTMDDITNFETSRINNSDRYTVSETARLVDGTPMTKGTTYTL